MSLIFNLRRFTSGLVLRVARPRSTADPLSSSSAAGPRLPVELCIEILSYCDRSTLAVASRVCTAWHQLARPRLYGNVLIDGNDQLARFFHQPSASRRRTVRVSVFDHYHSLSLVRTFTYIRTDQLRPRSSLYLNLDRLAGRAMHVDRLSLVFPDVYIAGSGTTCPVGVFLSEVFATRTLSLHARAAIDLGRLDDIVFLPTSPGLKRIELQNVDLWSYLPYTLEKFRGVEEIVFVVVGDFLYQGRRIGRDLHEDASRRHPEARYAFSVVVELSQKTLVLAGMKQFASAEAVERVRWEEPLVEG